MKPTVRRLVLGVLVLLLVGGLVAAVAFKAWEAVSAEGDTRRGRGGGPAPVEVAAIERGAIELRRTFSGTLESPAAVVVAPKVAGRMVALPVELADEVTRGQVVAELDDDEYVQAVAQSKAELAVAQANKAEAVSALEIARRELERVQTLRERGVASESQLDVAIADELGKRAAVDVAAAQVTRAEAVLGAATIRLQYTRVTATWTGGDDHRVVAERFVEVGDTVAANTPLLSIVELDPMLGVMNVTERDYGRLRPGQPVTLVVDAYPGRTFEGTVARVAPVFREASRQARVELTIPNSDRALRPGMFVRATATLEHLDDATIVPASAIVRRDDREVVFVLNDDGKTVRQTPVTVGIVDAGRAQVSGDGLTGRVVTLGQQLIQDGSEVVIPDEADAGAAARPQEAPSGR